jgi:hypothetical protein
MTHWLERTALTCAELWCDEIHLATSPAMEYPSLGGVACAMAAANFNATGLLVNRSMLVAIVLYIDPLINKGL